MTWGSPMLSVLAAGIAIPTLLILYFLKLKRRDVEVSTTLLWKKAIQDLQANAPFQKLRRNILLLLQLLALALVILALGQPEISGGEFSGTRHVIMIDRSGSMSAMDETDDGGRAVTRLERSQAEAMEYVDALREPGALSGGALGALLGGGQRDEAMVIAFDQTADVRQQFTNDKNLLRRAILGITPTDGPTEIDEALRLAGAYAEPELLEDRGLISSFNATLALWSDGRIADIADAAPPGESTVLYHKVGAADAANVSITSMRAERSYEDVARLGVFVGVQSTDPQKRSVDVELSVGGVIVAVRTVELFPVESDVSGRVATGGVVFEMNRVAGGTALARALVEDPLPNDDASHLVLPPARRVSVALVSSGNLYLRSALEGLNLARLAVLSPGQFQSAAQDGTLAGIDVYVLDNAVIPELDGELVPGRFLVFGAGGGAPGVTVAGDAHETPTVVIDWAREHPALQLAALDQIIIGGQENLAIESPAQVLAQTEHGPVGFEAAIGGARVLGIGFDPGRSTWPFDPGYVLFLASAIQYLGEAGETAAAATLRPGETLSTQIPMGASNVRLQLPGARNDTVPLTAGVSGRVSFGPLRRAGLYEMRWRGDAGPRDIEQDGTVRRLFAVNMADPAESDIRPAETLEMASRTVNAGPGGAGAVSRQPLWPWFIVGALVIVLLEWFVYNRKVAL